MRVLLTAFEPFGGESLNASLEVARRVAASTITGAQLSVLELPVERERSVDEIVEVLSGSVPDAIVMLGEAGYRSHVSVERIAINVDDYRIPDNGGNQPRNERIVEQGPVGYFSALPVERIVEQLGGASIPAELSNSAGTYICNRVFYSVMHWLAERGAAVRAGFVHVPFLHEQAAVKAPGCASLSLETLCHAVRIVIETTRDAEVQADDY